MGVLNHSPADLYTFGNTTMVALLVVVNYKVWQNTSTWTKVNAGVYSFFTFIPIIEILVLSVLCCNFGTFGEDMMGSGNATFGSAVPLLVILLVPQAVFLFDYAARFYFSFTKPS